jgi:hypothetical protein
MRDALDIYFLNQTIKTAKPKIAFSWTDIVDQIISQYNLPFDGGESIEAHIHAYRTHGADFRRQLDNLLSNGYILPSDKDESKYLLTKKAIDARKFETVEEFELTLNPPISDSKIDYKKFDRRVMSFLKKQDQTFGDISHIVNRFINGKQDNIIKIHKQLVHLREKEIIEIRDLPDDPMQMQDDWWGNLIGVNINSGNKVEGLKAKLSKGYLKLSWWEKNPSKTKLLDWGIPAILGYILGLLTCNATPVNKQSDQGASNTLIREHNQKVYENSSKDDN